LGFKSLIQNLFRILKSTLNKSCRELNFEQLLFWGQLVKISFSSSKSDFETILENLELNLEKEKHFSA
jgi:hypothetical protein